LFADYTDVGFGYIYIYIYIYYNRVSKETMKLETFVYKVRI